MHTKIAYLPIFQNLNAGNKCRAANDFSMLNLPELFEILDVLIRAILCNVREYFW